jgi:signal transduction histidine kinase
MTPGSDGVYTAPAALLIVEEDRELLRLLSAQASLRGYRVVPTAGIGELPGGAPAAADIVVLDLGASPEAGQDLIQRIRTGAPDAEIIVTSATSSMALALRAYEWSAFAFVQKPYDVGQLFATIDRALERRRMNLDNRRLVWELQTINEIADGIARTPGLMDVLNGALQRVLQAFDADGGSIRLKDPFTGVFEERARAGSPAMARMWNDFRMLPRPSDRVIALRTPFAIDDLQALLPADFGGALPIRSALSVPMTAGDELVGTLSVGAAAPLRFCSADERLLAIVAGQIAVAIQNARLHDTIARAKREWEQTFDAIGDPIALFDRRGQLLRGNAALAAHLGRPVTDLRGASCRDVGFCGDQCERCAVAGALAHREHRAEITLADGQIFSVTTFPVAGGSRGVSVVQVAKNVTEEIRSARRLRQMSEELEAANAQAIAALERLKSTQEQLLQSDKLSAIGQLVAGVAHELNNPLTSVIGYAQLLEEELRDPEAAGGLRPPAELAADLCNIAQESERAASIVRNLLAFARRQTAARAPQDPRLLFERVLALRSYELRLNNVEVTTEFEPGLPEVIADGSQLQQALLNLVLNAERAIRGRAERRLRVGARFDHAAAAVELFVSDTGHGIEHANLSRIFDPFFTTREVGEGTGLGLSICYGIVRDHGGQIAVESRVNVGTTFSLRLPARVEAEGGDAILVASADQGERDYLASALAGWGHPIVTAGSSGEALAACRVRRLQAIFIDTAVLAADLPGWRESRRSLPAPAPLVLVSRASDTGEVERFGREQASAVLAPPFQLRAIRSAVRAVSKEWV